MANNIQCSICGSEIPEGERTCPICGFEVQRPEPVNMQADYPQNDIGLNKPQQNEYGFDYSAFSTSSEKENVPVKKAAKTVKKRKRSGNAVIIPLIAFAVCIISLALFTASLFINYDSYYNSYYYNYAVIMDIKNI